MIKNIASFILTFLFFVNISYSQSQYKNPFGPLLPQKEAEPTEIDVDAAAEVTEEVLPSMVLQGVLWGGDSPQVIIDGEVYKVGERLKDLDAQIFKIEKSTVFIFYGEKVYKIKIEKKGEI